MKKALDSRMVLVILSMFVLSTILLPGYTTMVYAAEEGAGAGGGAGAGAGTAGAAAGTAAAAGITAGTIAIAAAVAAAAAIAIVASGGTTSTSVAAAAGTYTCLPVWQNNTSRGGTFTPGSSIAEYVCSTMDATSMHHLLITAHNNFNGQSWASFHAYLATVFHGYGFATSHTGTYP